MRIIPKSETAAITAIEERVRGTLSPVKIVIGRREDTLAWEYWFK
jgi:hypothetical protein